MGTGLIRDDAQEKLLRNRDVWRRSAARGSIQLLPFRYTLDLVYMRGFSLTIDRQYFEDFIRLGADEVFDGRRRVRRTKNQLRSSLNDRYKLYLRHY